MGARPVNPEVGAGSGIFERLAMNRAKMKAMVHHVIANSDPVRLGAIRLNKIMWYADTLAYRSTGASISGETYVKRQFGPVPKNVLNILGELEAENAIVVRDQPRFGVVLREFFAKTPSAPEGALSKDELAILEDVRGVICDEHTAMSISELSHDQVWEAANMGEEIPMAATLAAFPGEMVAQVEHWADRVIERYEAVAA